MWTKPQVKADGMGTEMEPGPLIASLSGSFPLIPSAFWLTLVHPYVILQGVACFFLGTIATRAQGYK